MPPALLPSLIIILILKNGKSRAVERGKKE
jgi:hypothetical protein